MSIIRKKTDEKIINEAARADHDWHEKCFEKRRTSRIWLSKHGYGIAWSARSRTRNQSGPGPKHENDAAALELLESTAGAADPQKTEKEKCFGRQEIHRMIVLALQLVYDLMVQLINSNAEIVDGHWPGEKMTRSTPCWSRRWIYREGTPRIWLRGDWGESRKRRDQNGRTGSGDYQDGDGERGNVRESDKHIHKICGKSSQQSGLAYPRRKSQELRSGCPHRSSNCQAITHWIKTISRNSCGRGDEEDILNRRTGADSQLKESPISIRSKAQIEKRKASWTHHQTKPAVHQEVDGSQGSVSFVYFTSSIKGNWNIERTVS